MRHGEKSYVLYSQTVWRNATEMERQGGEGEAEV